MDPHHVQVQVFTVSLLLFISSGPCWLVVFTQYSISTWQSITTGRGNGGSLASHWPSGLFHTFSPPLPVCSNIVKSIRVRKIPIRQLIPNADSYSDSHFLSSVLRQLGILCTNSFIRFTHYVIHYIFVLWRHIDTYLYGIQAKAAEQEEISQGIREPNRPSQLYKREQKVAGEWTIFLHLVESFMKSAPQLVLQLFIIARNETLLFSVMGSQSNLNNRFNLFATWLLILISVSWRTGIQIGSITSCLVSLAWSVTVFHTTISFKRNSISLFVSQLCIIGINQLLVASKYLINLQFLIIFTGGRVAALSLFASVFDGRDFWIVVLTHCIVISHIIRPHSHDVLIANDHLSNNWLSKWARKAWLAFLMDFTHMFTFVPFNENRSAHFRCIFSFYFVVKSGNNFFN